MNEAQFLLSLGYKPPKSTESALATPAIIQGRKPMPLTGMVETRTEVNALHEANKTTADRAFPGRVHGAAWV